MMFAIAVAARDRSGGHPLWHLLIVAAGAVSVFVVIKAKEHWDRDQNTSKKRSSTGRSSLPHRHRKPGGRS